MSGNLLEFRTEIQIKIDVVEYGCPKPCIVRIVLPIEFEIRSCHLKQAVALSVVFPVVRVVDGVGNPYAFSHLVIACPNEEVGTGMRRYPF